MRVSSGIRAAMLTMVTVLLLSWLYAGAAEGAEVKSNEIAAEQKYVIPERPTVYLTFDDGPSKLTPQVLDILKEHDVKATFFVLGELAEAREETVRRIAGEGHALGNHTYDHEYENLYSSFLHFWEQVRKTDETLTRIAGQRVRLLRAPGGTYTNFDSHYFSYLQEAGYIIHDWTLDSGDSKRRGVPAGEIVRNVKRARLSHEVNLLMHDGSGHKGTVEALPEIIRYFKGKGYSFEVLTEKVKPVTFRVGKLKWNRSMTERQHEQVLAAIHEASRESHPMLAARPETDVSRPVQVLGKTEDPEREWVALRDWASGKGTVTWDPVSKTAALAMGGTMLEFSPNAGKAVRLGTVAEQSAVDVSFRFENNRLYLLKSEAEAMLAQAYQTAAT
ncbi:polysaccharide deacetylase family protein [Paenibacillus alkalitolerans]|uniref:polysaccharide deacetylase family protein n=1 Tax=Paenibacillus alkalitolerans TaxID=2799335 RepID=UPI0018F36A1D|nr:polysaccharide deacetylase family protein [Paenibacillus alkalitolerans]